MRLRLLATLFGVTLACYFLSYLRALPVHVASYVASRTKGQLVIDLRPIAFIGSGGKNVGFILKGPSGDDVARGLCELTNVSSTWYFYSQVICPIPPMEVGKYPLFLSGDASCGAQSYAATGVDVEIIEDKLSSLRGKVAMIIGEAICESSAQCKSIGFGKKPCGGFWQYLIYSELKTETAFLEGNVSIYNALDEQRNEALGVPSTCDAVLQPRVECRNGFCMRQCPFGCAAPSDAHAPSTDGPTAASSEGPTFAPANTNPTRMNRQLL